VDGAEFDDVGVGDGGVEDEVVGLREAGLAGEHDERRWVSMAVAEGTFQRSGRGEGRGGLEDVGAWAASATW
jgi:hypothetical protein